MVIKKHILINILFIFVLFKRMQIKHNSGTLVHLNVVLLKICFQSHSKYGNIFVAALQEFGIICIGLYRLLDMAITVQVKERKTKTFSSSSKRYVITNPTKEFAMLPTDMVISFHMKNLKLILIVYYSVLHHIVYLFHRCFVCNLIHMTTTTTTTTTKTTIHRQMIRDLDQCHDVL